METAAGGYAIFRFTRIQCNAKRNRDIHSAILWWWIRPPTYTFVCRFFFIYHSVAHTHRVNQAINKIGFFSIINKLFGFYCPNFGFIYLFFTLAQNVSLFLYLFLAQQGKCTQNLILFNCFAEVDNVKLDQAQKYN